MKVFKKIFYSLIALVLVAGVGIFAGCKIDDNFNKQVCTFFKIEQKTDKNAAAVSKEELISDLDDRLLKLSIQFEEFSSDLTQKNTELQKFKNKLDELQLDSESNYAEIEIVKTNIASLTTEIASVNEILVDINSQISLIQNLLQEIQNSTHNIQAKMCNLKGGLTAVGSVTLGSVTMNCNGGTLIFIGTTCAKVNEHMGYVTLKIDNGEHILMSAFDHATGFLSRPYFYLVEGVTPGEHTFTISVIGQNFTETVNIANYTWAHGLFIEI